MLRMKSHVPNKLVLSKFLFQSLIIAASSRAACCLLWWLDAPETAQKMKFSIKDYFSKCNQIQSFLRI